MPPRSREAAKAQTRVALLEAGVALFAAQGLDKPSLDAICERAGYTRGAFYVHFSDRDDFMAAVMEHLARPLLDRLLGIGSQDLPGIVTQFVQMVADGTYPLTPAGGIRPHQLLDACARSERIGGLYVRLIDEFVGRLAGAIARSQRAGAVRADLDPDTTARVMMSVVLGAQTMLELGVSLDVAAVARTVLALVTPGT